MSGSTTTAAVPSVSDLLTLAVECGLVRMSKVMDPDLQDALEAFARRLAAATAPAALDPVHGDVLPAVGSRVFIRHGRDDDAHACIVTGYYAWPALGGVKHLHRVFVRLVYEGTDTANARLLDECWPTAEAALAGAKPAEPEPWSVHEEAAAQRRQFNAAIDFAVEQGIEADSFLRAWREGDTSEWPEFASGVRA